MRPASSARVLAHNTSSCSNFLAVLGLTLIVLGFIIPPLLQHALDEGVRQSWPVVLQIRLYSGQWEQSGDCTSTFKSQKLKLFLEPTQHCFRCCHFPQIKSAVIWRPESPPEVDGEYLNYPGQ